MTAKTPLFLVALVSMTASCVAAELDFYRDVYPFLKANCISCHNKTTTKADLNMETPELLKKGGETGPGLVPGKSAESLIVQASMHKHDLEMPPPKNKSGAVDLTAAELSLLKMWIDQGAKSSVQEERQVVWQPLAPGVHPIYSVAMTKDGRYAACGRSNQIFVYDLATRQFVTQVVDRTQKSGTAHRALVQALAFSPDGARLASGSFQEVKIWRREQRKATTRKADASLAAVASTLSIDGKRIVCADKAGALLVLDAASGQVIKKIADANKAGIKLVSMSPDATKAAVYGADATLSLWNLQDGKSLASKAGQAGIRALGWTADAKTIATAGDDKIVRLWLVPAAPGGELTAGKELKGAVAAVTGLVGGATPDQLITASADGKAQVWSVAGAKVVKVISSPGILCLALSHDGSQLATGGADGVVRVWDIASGKQVSELRGNVTMSQQMAGMDLTVAAQTLEQAFQKTEVTRIEAQNKALEELLKKAREAIVTMNKALPVKQKAVEPARAAKAAAQKALDDVAALIAKAPEGKPSAALEKQQREAQEKLASTSMAETSALAAFSGVESNVKDAEADVKRITESQAKNSHDLAVANAAIEGAKKTQDKAAAELAAAKQALTKGSTKPLCVTFSTDAQEIAAVFSDGTLNVWAAASATPIEQVAGTATPAATLAPQADGTFAACMVDGTTMNTGTSSRWVLERVIGGEKDHAVFADRVNAVRFSPDGRTLATGGGEPSRSGDISLFDVGSGKLVKSWPERHEDAVLCLDFSPDGKRIASGAADKLARVTDIATGKQVNVFEGHTHHIMGVGFRADGRVLATAGADGVVITWDMIVGERKKKIEGWTKEVTSLQFIGATNQIVTSAGDNLIRIVNDEGTEVRAIAKLPDFMQSAASTATGGTIIGGGEDSFLRVWDGTSAKEVAVFGTSQGSLIGR